MANELINPDKLRKEMDAMTEMLSHPEFVAAMKLIKSTPLSKRNALAKKTLTIQAPREKGVKIPEGMRLTTRYFEPGKTEMLEIGPDGTARKVAKSKIGIEFPGGINTNGSLAWGGCACGGIGSICGGGGFSTT